LVAIKAVTFFMAARREKVLGAAEGVNLVGTRFNQNRMAMNSLISISSHDLGFQDGGNKVQEAIWRLQDEVKVLQEELVRTRRALEQREVLLRNSQQRELELRAEVGDGRR
jgi:hypothetical protein